MSKRIDILDKLTFEEKRVLKLLEILVFLKYPIVDVARHDYFYRKHLQKLIYLIQVVGINLGYKYYWHVFGPYSPWLTQDLIGLEEVIKEWQNQ